MAIQVINVGTKANGGGGDPLRDAMIKINENFEELYDRTGGDVASTIIGADSTVLVDGPNSSLNAAALSGTAPAGVVTFDNIGDTPTSLGGYGITDAYTKSQTLQRIEIAISDLADEGGDLKGSVFADDSTLLVDGVNGTIPAVNLSGALPAIDGSNLLNIGVGENITAVVEDTTPQLGGNLDLNSADITGEGNIDITGNIANTGNTTVTGTLKVDSGNNIVIEKTVSGNNETFGNIIATTGTTEYAKIEFKTGADGFADNSEINWFSRVGGSSVQIFEIKGSSLGKSGFEINPGANLNVDFFMQGAADPFLIFADSGLDKIGFGKIPTQGKVDVDGDIYATTIRGTIVATAGSAPAAGSDPGDEGEIRFDNDYIYVKTPGGSWKRVALSSIV